MKTEIYYMTKEGRTVICPVCNTKAEFVDRLSDIPGDSLDQYKDYPGFSHNGCSNEYYKHVITIQGNHYLYERRPR